MTGFGSLSNFSAAFKHEKGISTRVYESVKKELFLNIFSIQHKTLIQIDVFSNGIYYKFEYKNCQFLNDIKTI